MGSKRKTAPFKGLRLHPPSDSPEWDSLLKVSFHPLGAVAQDRVDLLRDQEVMQGLEGCFFPTHRSGSLISRPLPENDLSQYFWDGSCHHPSCLPLCR